MLRAACAAVLLSLATSAFAQRSEDPRLDFQAGRAAFEAQNFELALESFEIALASGMSGPAVHFNIGVSAYRLGNYPRAAAAFQEVAHTPEMAALAHYNLGLVARAAGDRQAAAHWFALAQEQAQDERLRDLASRQLSDLQPPQPVIERNWIGYAALAAGYDDNVALVADSSLIQVSGSEDSFAELQLAFSAPLAKPWQLDASAILTDYQDLDRFDQVNFQGGGRYRVAAGRLNVDMGLQFAYATLDHEGFESKRMAQLQASTPLDERWLFRARYRFSDIDGLNEFESLGGSRHEVALRAARQGPVWTFGVEYRFDANDYEDEALSAQRHQIGVDVERTFSHGWVVLAGATARHSKYELTASGTEDRSDVTLGLAKTLGAHWRLVVRYAYAQNDADLPDLNYERNQVSATLEAVL